MTILSIVGKVCDTIWRPIFKAFLYNCIWTLPSSQRPESESTSSLPSLPLAFNTIQSDYTNLLRNYLDHNMSFVVIPCLQHYCGFFSQPLPGRMFCVTPSRGPAPLGTSTLSVHAHLPFPHLILFHSILLLTRPDLPW